jgi:hypothetical protein
MKSRRRGFGSPNPSRMTSFMFFTAWKRPFRKVAPRRSP